MLESEVFQYTQNKFLAVSVDLPLIGEVTEASDIKPYLCVQIDIEAQKMSELAMKLGPEIASASQSERGIFVGDMDADLTNSIIRLMRLLDR